MRLLIDMNLSPRWCEAFAGAGIEAVHWSSVGSPTAPDAEIMRYAAAEGRTVITHDLDFGAILAATGRRKPSVVQLRDADISPEGGCEAMIAALRQCSAELESGALLTIDTRRASLSLLRLGM